MALTATLHRFDLEVADVDRGIETALTLPAARHPSETMARLWLRVLALGWQHADGIGFGPGLCEPDAPDVLAAAPGGGLSVLVRVGSPDPARVERDVRANSGARVAVLFASPRELEAFRARAAADGLARAAAADLAAVEPAVLSALAAIDDRRIRVRLTFVSDHVYVDVGGRTLDSPLVRFP
jgi:uncharacterized protein YaeQ